MKKLFFLLLIPIVSFSQNDSVQTNLENSVIIRCKSTFAEPNALLIVDGKIMEYEKINKINPDEIESINVLKGEKAIEEYGEAGKNGAVEINLKEKKDSLNLTEILNGTVLGLKNINSITVLEKQFPGTVCQASVRNYPKPNIVVDGELVSEEFLKNLNLNEIESIQIIKNGELSHINLNGTILIKTKKNLEESEFDFIDYAEGITTPEYDLVVSDLGYESFLSMQPPAATYSLNYLQNKNRHYVSVWNSRVITGNPEIYENSINYDSRTFYGLDFEYKLFMFFKFMEDKHKISFT